MKGDGFFDKYKPVYCKECNRVVAYIDKDNNTNFKVGCC